VGVVERQQQRALRRQVRRQPIEPMQHRALIATARRAAGPQRQRRCRQRRRAAKQPLALRGRRRSQRALKELAHHSEGKPVLELPAAPLEHTHPPPPREPHRVGEQRRLPNPRRTLDRHRRAMAANRRLDPR
jgi:hypothetical protein